MKNYHFKRFALSLYAKDIEIKDAFIKQAPPNAVNSAILFLTIVNDTTSL